MRQNVNEILTSLGFMVIEINGYDVEYDDVLESNVLSYTCTCDELDVLVEISINLDGLHIKVCKFYNNEVNVLFEQIYN